MEKCRLVTILAYFLGCFSSFQYQLIVDLSHFLINPAFDAATLDFGLLNGARRAFFTLICDPRRHFPSHCGPSIVLSLRPLIYVEAFKQLLNSLYYGTFLPIIVSKKAVENSSFSSVIIVGQGGLQPNGLNFKGSEKKNLIIYLLLF